MLKRVTVIKTRVNKGSGDSSGGGKVKNVTDTTEVTYVVMAGARKGGNLFGIGCVEVRESDRLMILEVYCGSKSKKKIISWERLRVR